MGVTVTAYPPYHAYPGPSPVLVAPPPILVAVAHPAPQQRLTVALRLIMVVPHLIVLWLLSIAAVVVAFIGWWGALFTARLPGFAVSFLSGYLRWSTRVAAYLMLLTDAYPPFTPDEVPGYPVQVAIPEPQRLNRAAVLFRFILLIPVAIVSGVVRYGTGVMAIIAWLITLVAGRLPISFHLAYVAALRFQTRFYGYQLMLTPAYPGGLYGDTPGTVTWADAAAPGFDAPATGYGTPGGYGVPGGYGAAGGYGVPGGYGVAGGYGPAGGYNPGPGFQPAAWPLPLTSAAKVLVTTFIVLGAICIIVQNVYNNATANNSQTQTAIMIDL